MQRHLRTQPQKLRAFIIHISRRCSRSFRLRHDAMATADNLAHVGEVSIRSKTLLHTFTIGIRQFGFARRSSRRCFKCAFYLTHAQRDRHRSVYSVYTGFIFSTLKRGVTATHFPVLAFVLTTVLFCGMATSHGDPETSFCIAYRFTALSWMMLLLCASIFLSPAVTNYKT